ncbi:MAG: hypothetical protein ACREBV_08610, partial [Candidatus Zixiibacteriota bacterium]
GAGDYDVTIRVIDSCRNSSTYTRTITVELNSPPQVEMGDAHSVEVCTVNVVCIDVSVGDPDGNLFSFGSNFGVVHEGVVCFEADTSGVYTIIGTAIDSCGAINVDTVKVTVTVNKPPYVDLGENHSREVCLGDTICIPLVIEDDNLEDVGSNFSITDLDFMCIPVDSSGQYIVIVEAYDSCGVETRDSVIISVTTPPAPFVSIGNDIRATICSPTEFCIDVETIANPISVVFNRVGYNPDTRRFCWTASSTILDLLKVTVTDSCGRTATDSISVYIKINTPPKVQVAMRDTTVYLCQPSYVCLPLVFVDSQSNIAGIQVNRGQYSIAQVCFVPYDSGTYTIIATATDSCGAITADTAIVKVRTDQYVQLQCPRDTTVFMCTHDTLCFPIGNIPEWAQIQVTGINTWYDPITKNVCFYVTCGVRNHIVVKAITPCDTISCSFNVTVRCN